MKRQSKDLGQSVGLLPIEKRIERYRQFADAAFLKAQRADNPDQKAEYLSMAAGWHSMALEAERLDGVAVTQVGDRGQTASEEH